MKRSSQMLHEITKKILLFAHKMYSNQSSNKKLGLRESPSFFSISKLVDFAMFFFINLHSTKCNQQSTTLKCKLNG
jgi:hypothetical protein